MQRPPYYFHIVAIISLALIQPTFAKANQRKTDFLNTKTQKRRVHLLFKFQGPRSARLSMPKTDNHGSPIIYQYWKDKEKEQIIYELETVISAYPGLVLNASSGQSINLFRIKKLDSKLSSRKRSNCLATAYPKSKSISISDLYFPNKKKNSNSGLYRTLIHELVHLADCGNRYSYSKVWIKAAYPKIREAKFFWRLRLKSKIHKIAKTNNLPSTYSTKNLRECLAECASTYLAEGYPDTKIAKVFKKKIEPKLLQPTQEECLWSINFIKGQKALQKGNLKLAKNQILKAMKINPSVPELLDDYARLLYLEKSYEKGLSVSKQSVKDLDELMKEENYYPSIQRLKHHAIRLTQLDKFEEAIPYFNKLISAGCYEHYKDRAVCYEKMDKLYEAANDYASSAWAAKGCATATVGIISREQLHIKKLQDLNAKIEKKPKSAELRLKRANYLAFADLETYKGKKEHLFNRGIKDYEYVLSLTDEEITKLKRKIRREELEWDCAYFCYKFERFRAAINHCDAILQINPESHKIFGIKFGSLSSLGQNQKANTLYKNFESKILSTPQSAPKRNFRSNYFRFLDHKYYKCKKKNMLLLAYKDLYLILKKPDREIKKCWLEDRVTVESECAELCFILGKYKTAISHCDRILLLNSNRHSSRAKIIKIGAYERSNQKKIAITYFKKFKKSCKL